MNHKGQSLIIFVILLPFFLLILSGVAELGYVLVNKKELVNTTNYCNQVKQLNCMTHNQIDYNEQTKIASRKITGLIYKYNLEIKYQYQE